MKIKVTQNHINLGFPCSSIGCPIALALKEATGNRAVISSIIQLRDADDNIIFARPATEEECKFMSKFDLGKEVQPFELEIDFENPNNE